MWSSLFQIAKNTFRESLREPIYLLVLLSALCLIGIFPMFTLFVFREQVKLVVDSAMATTMVFGWIVAVLCASHAIAREIDNGTVLLLLAKPVRRHVFIMAKIVGVLLALTVFCALTCLAALIAVRIAKDQFRFDNTVLAIYFGAIALSMAIGGVHNYVTRSSFPMAAVYALLAVLPLAFLIIYFVPSEGERVAYSWSVVPALVLVVYSVWAMGTLATTLSTRLGLVPNLLVCTVIFAVGLMSDYLIGRHVYEAWRDTVPRGVSTLWVSAYTFDPNERIDVGDWSVPERADPGTAGPLVVWSDASEPGGLPQMGLNPHEGWADDASWHNNVTDLEQPPVYMARYDADQREWERRRVSGEGRLAQRRRERQGNAEPYVSYVFRRSAHRPRTPAGGTYRRPVPDPGNPLASALYACIPNWQLFWMADALAAKRAIPTQYVVLGGVYVLLLVAFFVVVAVALFCNREIGQQMTM